MHHVWNRQVARRQAALPAVGQAGLRRGGHVHPDVQPGTAHGALPHRAPSTRCTADLASPLVWHRFNLADAAECRAFFSLPSRAAHRWVLKIQKHGGGGVLHISGAADFEAKLRAPYSRCDGNFSKSVPPAFVQRNIEPHLHEGRKYDLREFILLRAPTSRTPAAAFHLPHGFARVCTEPYAHRDEPARRRWALVCNFDVAKDHPRFAHIQYPPAPGAPDAVGQLGMACVPQSSNVCTDMSREFVAISQYRWPSRVLLGRYPAMSARVDAAVAQAAAAMVETLRTFPRYLDELAVENRATASSLDTPCTFPRCTADSVHHVWHRSRRTG